MTPPQQSKWPIEVVRQMSNRRYRFTCGLIYFIRDKGGNIVPFKPSAEQLEILDALDRGWEFLIIPKSRQRGISTMLALIVLDSMIFTTRAIQASIVDQTATDAQKKLEEKIRLAFSKLPPELAAGLKVVTDNDTEFRINTIERHTAGESSAECFVFAGERARGGTNQILWISEWGEVQMKDPRRSTEILTGALPSAAHDGCVTIVETTWKGGKSGDLWNLVVQAESIPEEKKSKKDPRIIFIPWWTDPEAVDNGPADLVTRATNEYCDQVERLSGTTLSPAQRLWYQKREQTLGMFVKSEHPSTLQECFEAPTQGAFFDEEGLKWQESQAVALESQWQFGEIVMQGGRVPFFQPRDRRFATVQILEMPQDGESYLLCADFCGQRMATGATGERDTNAYMVIKAARMDRESRVMHHAQVVAMCLADDREGTPETVRRIVALHKLYGNCMTVPEINNKDNICGQLEAAGCNNIWTQRTGSDGARPGHGQTELVKGWLTSGTRDGGGTRKQMLEYLREQIRERAIIISSGPILKQLQNFIINKKGKPEAAPGTHDDWVLSLGIGVFTLNAATPYHSMRGMSMFSYGPGGWDGGTILSPGGL